MSAQSMTTQARYMRRRRKLAIAKQLCAMCSLRPHAPDRKCCQECLDRQKQYDGAKTRS